MGGATNFSRLSRRLSLLLACAVFGAAIAVVPAGAAKPDDKGPGGSASVNLDQCANGNAPAACDWQNGNLNGNNSSYNEGDVVPFRLTIEGLAAGQHSIHINYDFTAGGRKAYDFLASYESTENVDLCASGGGGVSSLCGATGEAGLPAPVLVPFPSDDFNADGQLVSGAEAISGVTRNLTIYGATVGADPISGIVHSGDTTGNSTADLTVTFTTAGASSAVLLAWGGHLAASYYWITNNGSGQVSGAPWHMRTQNLDGAGSANQDRSIQASAIDPVGSITVVKQTDPDGSTQSFSFDPSWSTTNFNLTDGRTAASGDLVPGTYSVAEVNMPAGWTQSSAVCSDGSPVSAIVLNENESVSCVFTNTLGRGTIRVAKQTTSDGGGQSFEFDPSWSATNSNLTDGQFFSSPQLLPDTYSVAEVNIPAGWELSGATCTDGSPVTAIELAAGEIVTCTFVNTTLPDPEPGTGTITVLKQTVPGGETERFNFDPSWGAEFDLADGQTASGLNLTPGTYSVAEIDIPAGWELTSSICDNDGSPVPVTDIDLAAGDTILCTFTNTLAPVSALGSITVVKETSPNGSSQSFSFDLPWSATNVSLTDGQSASNGALAAGTYSVAEVDIPADWTLTGATCTDNSPVTAINLAAGEQVTCTFVNTLTVTPANDPPANDPPATNPPPTEVESQTATSTPGDNPTPPLQTVPVSTPVVPAPVTGSTPATSGQELPRTGAAGLREEALLGLLLMLAGLLARGAGRRNRPSEI